jgi:hypothetical protein
MVCGLVVKMAVFRLIVTYITTLAKESNTMKEKKPGIVGVFLTFRSAAAPYSWISSVLLIKKSWRWRELPFGLGPNLAVRHSNLRTCLVLVGGLDAGSIPAFKAMATFFVYGKIFRQ